MAPSIDIVIIILHYKGININCNYLLFCYHPCNKNKKRTGAKPVLFVCPDGP